MMKLVMLQVSIPLELRFGMEEIIETRLFLMVITHLKILITTVQRKGIRTIPATRDHSELNLAVKGLEPITRHRYGRKLRDQVFYPVMVKTYPALQNNM
ncbi:unnamed protein product [Vicia faba]|uniref:Uncharacterized protein n=1 Tax=Vicia faba TaxID=3906 RepID=A0AAV1AZC3_VICFA|nr:unnamed protein product [Vicia faba]